MLVNSQKGCNSAKFVIPAKVGIQLFHDVLDPGACPGLDPGFAGVTTKRLPRKLVRVAVLFFVGAASCREIEAESLSHISLSRKWRCARWLTSKEI
jgi:hypothetical protein